MHHTDPDNAAQVSSVSFTQITFGFPGGSGRKSQMSITILLKW